LATQDRAKLARKYDRRVDIIRPVDEDNSVNEAGTGSLVVYSNYPAQRLDSVNGAGEDLAEHVASGSVECEWDLRFIPDLNNKTNGVKTTWKLRDVFTDQFYEIIAPITEIGRGEGWRVKTMILQ